MIATRSCGLVVALALGLVAAPLVNLPAEADVLASGNLPATFGLRFGPDGNLYVCTQAGLAVLDLEMGQLVDLIGPERGVHGPEDVIFGADGSMYWAEMFLGDVGRMAPDGTVTPVVGGLLLSMQGAGMMPPFGVINGIDVGPSGAIHVAGDLGNLIYRLTPRTLYLPGAAHTPGFNGSRWTTDLELHNRGGDSASYAVVLLLRGQDNSAPAATAFELAPDTSVRYRDVIGELFEVEGAGALRVTAVGGDLMAAAHTRTVGDGGSYGQYIEGMDADDAAGEASELRLIQLENSADARTNIGVVSACPIPMIVEVGLFEADGTPAGAEQLELEPFGTSQMSDVFGSLGGKTALGGALQSGSDVYAVVSSATPGASFFAYASVVDNGTNDPIFVPGR